MSNKRLENQDELITVLENNMVKIGIKIFYEISAFIKCFKN